MSLQVLNQARTSRAMIVDVNPQANFNVFYYRAAGGEGISMSPARSNIYPQPVVPPKTRSSIPIRGGASIPPSSYQGSSQVSSSAQAPQINIDPERLYEGSAKGKPAKSYTVSELREIATQLGLTTTGIKKDLIERIRGAIFQ